MNCVRVFHPNQLPHISCVYDLVLDWIKDDFPTKNIMGLFREESLACF